MTKLPRISAWVGAAACMASALGFAGRGFAQQDAQRSQDQQQQTSDQTDPSRDLRDQQQRQSDQQGQRQSDQSQWDESRNRQRSQQDSTWPEPNRDGRQDTQFQSDRERQSFQSGSRPDERDGGLGVNIISDQGPGVVVTRVFGGTPADIMGIRSGDRITQLNSQDVRTVNEFISRIRNMNPGDEVELEVLRNRDERTVRGELETRQEALLLTNRQQLGRQWEQGDRSWQTGYQEGGSFQPRSRTMQGGDYNSRLISIEQQVDRLGRELEQIRFALQDLRQDERGFQQFGGTRESQAGYNEYQGGYESQGFGTRPQSDQWDGRSNQGFRQSDRYQQGGQQRRFEGSQRTDQSSARDAVEGGSEGPGGITGGRRTRPDSDLDRLDQ